jgi:O-antigen ligase
MLRSNAMPVAPVSGSRWGTAVIAGATGMGVAVAVVCLVSSASHKAAIAVILAFFAAMALPALTYAAGGARRLVVIAYVLSLPISIDVFLIYRPSGYPGGVNGISLNPTLVAAMAMVGLQVLSLLFGRRRDAWRAARPLVGPAVGLLLASVLSVVHAIDKHQWVYGLWLNGSMILIAVAACQIVAGGSVRDLRLVWGLLLVTLSFEGAFVILQTALGINFTLEGDVLNRGASSAAGSVQRFTGTFGVPSETGTFLTVTLLLAMPLLFVRKLRFPFVLVVATFTLGLVGLLMTLARTAWIAFAAGAFVIGRDLQRRRLLRPGIVTAAACGAVVALIAAGPMLSQRVGADHEGDLLVRWHLVRIAMEMIKSNPLFGVGLNTASLVVTNYVPAGLGHIWVFVVHNQFLLTTCESGIPGLVSLIWFFVVAFRALRGPCASPDPVIREFAGALRVVLGVLVLALNLDFVQGSQTYPLVFLMIGLATGLQWLAAAAPEPTPESEVSP